MSRYTDNKKYFYGYFMFYVFMSVISLFTLFPYAYYLYSRRKYNNMYVDGKRVRFDGKIEDAYYTFTFGFVLMVVIIILVNSLATTIIMNLPFELPSYVLDYVPKLISSLPLMLFTVFILNGMYKWAITNSHFVGSKLDTRVSFLKFNLISMVITTIVKKILSLFLVFVGMPIMFWLKERYIINREFLSNEKLKFTGTIRGSFYHLLVRYLLSFVTFGLYYPLYQYALNKYSITNTHLEANIDTTNAFKKVIKKLKKKKDKKKTDKI